MVLRLSTHLKLSRATTYEALPPHVRIYFDGIRYCDVVKPLIVADSRAGKSTRQLAIKYGLSQNAIQHHLSRKSEGCEQVNQ